MITIEGVRAFFWRNLFSDHPVALLGIEPGGATAWWSEELSDDVVEIIADRFPAVRTDPTGSGVTGFLAAVCLSIQQEKFDVPPDAAADPQQFWFATLDHYYAFAVAHNGVALLNRLITRPHPNVSETEAALSLFEDHCEAAALDQSTGPWRRRRAPGAFRGSGSSRRCGICNSARAPNGGVCEKLCATTSR